MKEQEIKIKEILDSRLTGFIDNDKLIVPQRKERFIKYIEKLAILEDLIDNKILVLKSEVAKEILKWLNFQHIIELKGNPKNPINQVIDEIIEHIKKEYGVEL